MLVLMQSMDQQYPKLGPYYLLHRLAVGGMAEVFLAHNPEASKEQQIVVVKQIRDDLTNNQEFVDMFIDEERVISSLHHPNIVQLHGFGEEKGRYYLVLEYVWGESLALLTSLCMEQKVRFPASAAIYIASEVAAALEHAHQHRDSMGFPSPVIHRDVTLGNVVVSYTGEVKILDFGIAKAKGRLAETRAGHVKGTLGYLAPEQILGLPVGPWTDIYQLGVLLYHAVVGRAPLTATRDVDLMALITKGHIPRPTKIIPGFPPLLERVIMRALAKDPEDRYPSAAAFYEVLRHLVAPVLPKAAASLGRLMLRITGDRHERQQAFIQALFDGQQQAQEQVEDNLFDWAFDEVDEQTESTQFSVDIDTHEMDPDATSRISIQDIEDYTRNLELAAEERTEVNSLETLSDADKVHIAARKTVARQAFPDINTISDDDEYAGADDVQNEQDYSSSQSATSIPRPVSGIFQNFHRELQDEIGEHTDGPEPQVPSEDLFRENSADNSTDDDEADALTLSDFPNPQGALPALSEDDLQETVEVSQLALEQLKQHYSSTQHQEQTRRNRRRQQEQLDSLESLDIRDEPTQIELSNPRIKGPPGLLSTAAEPLPLLAEKERADSQFPRLESDGVLRQSPEIFSPENETERPLGEALREAFEKEAEDEPEPIRLGDIADEVTEPKFLPQSLAPRSAEYSSPANLPKGPPFDAGTGLSEYSIDLRRLQNPLRRFALPAFILFVIAAIVVMLVVKPQYAGFIGDGLSGLWSGLAGDSQSSSPSTEIPPVSQNTLLPPLLHDAGSQSLILDAATKSPVLSGAQIHEQTGRHDKKSKQRAKLPSGNIKISGGSELLVSYHGRRQRQKAQLSLRGSKGVFRMSSEGMSARFIYQVVGDEIRFRVLSQPPAKLSYNNLQVGETPKVMMLGNFFNLELIGFEAGQRLKASIEFTPR